MRTAVIVVTGVHEVAMDTATMGLLWELGDAVAVTHRIDPVAQTLTRTVSDSGGMLEQKVIDLEHACMYCALREDILPTLLRLAEQGRWGTIVASLPISAEAEQLSKVLSQDPIVARRLRIASIIAAVESTDLAAVLLGDDLLIERHLHTGPHDDRGLGETACSLLEFADVVVTTQPLVERDADLLAAIKRPSARLVTGAENLPARELAAQRHNNVSASEWRLPITDDDLPNLASSNVWRLDLRSEMAMDPGLLLDHIEELGSGPFRTRGCLWVPTRPDTCVSWEGAGGHLTIGARGSWEPYPPRTRLVYTGVGIAPIHLLAVFNQMLVSPNAATDAYEDGLEPWLGAIHRAA
jgi:G3E family GTPase